MDQGWILKKEKQMQVRLFLNRMAVLLMRSGWFIKIAITSILLSLILITWYFGLHCAQKQMQSKITFQVAELSNQKQIFDEVSNEYANLNKVSENFDYTGSGFEQTNPCQLVVDQIRSANLNLQSYTCKKNKDNFKQMFFSFIGTYQEVLAFLDYLNRVAPAVNCQKLRITKASHRLQIDYVCGIHTFVK